MNNELNLPLDINLDDISKYLEITDLGACRACTLGTYAALPRNREDTNDPDKLRFVHWIQSLSHQWIQFTTEKMNKNEKISVLDFDGDVNQFTGFVYFVCTNCGDTKTIFAEAMFGYVETEKKKEDNDDS